jgi:SnoaL-like protein
MTAEGDLRPDRLALAWRDALLARDAGAFAALFAPEGLMVDVEHRTADLARPLPLLGREMIEAQTRSWFEVTPRFAFDVLEAIGSGKSGAFRWRYAVPGETEEIALEGVTWLTCERGQITEAFVYFDSYALLRGLGSA